MTDFDREWCVNINTKATAALLKKSKNAMACWFEATSQLLPGQSAQLLEFSNAPKGVQAGIPELVEAGLLRPRKGSQWKFYVPRALAFASLEEPFEGIRVQSSVDRVSS